MRKIILLSIAVLIQVGTIAAQSLQRPDQAPASGAPAASQLTGGINLRETNSVFLLEANKMDDAKLQKLNETANSYRATRGMLTDFGNAMLQGGTTSIVNLVGTEIINLLQIRSKQKRKWTEMRQQECIFVDSMQSVSGQSDFYSRQSSYGPLDPSNMQFDGITLTASRQGREVLNLVCHIDSSRLSHIFLHSKFYLVIDSLTFYPYRSFLPNMGAVTAKMSPGTEMSQDERDYWETISHFDFDELLAPSLNVRIDLYSSWINELAQVFHDVRLGTFTVDLPFTPKDLTDSVYTYSRQQALATGSTLLEMNGDCFVVPRSFMPVSIDNPSWGTGEYKMKMVFTQRCRYNPDGKRAQNWRSDYKQLVKMMNNGKNRSDYLDDMVTTFRDNRFAILKATYQPALTKGGSMVKLKTSSGQQKPAAGASGMSGKP